MKGRLLGFLLLATACACRSGDEASETYVDEAFAVWAGSFEQPLQDLDLDTLAGEFDQQAVAWGRLTAPSDLQDEHDDLVSSFSNAAAALREMGEQGDLSDPEVAPIAQELGDAYETWAGELENRYGALFVRMDGGSMEPTLADGDGMHVALDRDDPSRGKIIYFTFHLNPDRSFARRVIGLPGETVEVRDGSVFINDEPLEEDYVLDQPTYTYGPRKIPDGRYFVLGDNRRNSFDSHAWELQCLVPDSGCEFVPEENIIGVLRAAAKVAQATDE